MKAAMGRWAVLVGSVGVALYGAFAYFFLEPGSTVHPAMRAAYAENPVRLLLHVGFGAVAILTGPLQFFPGLRRSRPLLHRRIGYIYFAAVGISGVSGLFVAAIAFGGLVVEVGFGLLSALWLLTAGLALAAAVRRNWQAHERWALRCFAMTFAAVTLRLQMGTCFATGMGFEQFYPVLAWSCWVPNLLFVEWVLLAPRRRV